MTVSSAPPAEQTRVRPRGGARRGELQPTLIARSVSTAPSRPLDTPLKFRSGRAETQAARRLERRRRQMLAAMGVLVLVGMLVLTVIVLDLFH